MAVPPSGHGGAFTPAAAVYGGQSGRRRPGSPPTARTTRRWRPSCPRPPSAGREARRAAGFLVQDLGGAGLDRDPGLRGRFLGVTESGVDEPAAGLRHRDVPAIHAVAGRSEGGGQLLPGASCDQDCAAGCAVRLGSHDDIDPGALSGRPPVGLARLGPLTGVVGDRSPRGQQGQRQGQRGDREPGRPDRREPGAWQLLGSEHYQCRTAQREKQGRDDLVAATGVPCGRRGAAARTPRARPPGRRAPATGTCATCGPRRPRGRRRARAARSAWSTRDRREPESRPAVRRWRPGPRA